MDVEVDDRVVSFRVFLKSCLDGVVEFFVVPVAEAGAAGLGDFKRDFAPLIFADFFKIDEQAGDITVDEGCA